MHYVTLALRGKSFKLNQRLTPIGSILDPVVILEMTRTHNTTIMISEAT